MYTPQDTRHSTQHNIIPDFRVDSPKYSYSLYSLLSSSEYSVSDGYNPIFPGSDTSGKKGYTRKKEITKIEIPPDRADLQLQTLIDRPPEVQSALGKVGAKVDGNQKREKSKTEKSKRKKKRKAQGPILGAKIEINWICLGAARVSRQV